MKSNKIAILLLPVAALCLAYVFFQKKNERRLYQEADTYALSYGLKPLRAGGGNELRLWFLEPMEGGIAATIIAENGAVRCAGKSRNASGDAQLIVGAGSCRKSTIALPSADLESKLHSLSRLRNSNASCDELADGWGVIVQGLVEDEQFAFEAWNPDGCDTPDAKKLAELLESIAR